MENNPKKSKALIITIIIIIIILLAGFLIFKNRDSFGVKTSAIITKIFSPLVPSLNNANLTTVDVQAGEDIAKGDSVSVFGTGTNNNPIVVKTSTNNGTVYGYANQDIKSGYAGKVVVPSNTGSSGFWNSISSFINNIITPTAPVIPSNNNVCTNSAVNYPDCTINNNGECINGATNPSLCTINISPIYQCSDKKDNDGDGLIDAEDPNCHIDGDISYGWIPTHNDESSNAIDPNAIPTVTVTANPSSVAKGEEPSLISWTSTNSKTCDSGDLTRGTGTTGSFLTGPLTTSTSYTVSCVGVNDLTSSDNVFVEVTGSNNISDLVASRVTPITAVINVPTVLSSVIKNIGNGEAKGNFPNYFRIKNTDTNQSSIFSKVSPAIAAKSEGTIELKHTFTVLGNYSITVCADQNDPTDKGRITEASETNNCSDPINFRVTDKPIPETNLPDLTANRVSPSIAFINTPTTLSSIITNIGKVNTDSSFSGYFSIKSVGNTSTSYTSSITIPTLPAGISNTATMQYTFRMKGSYSIIACADKSNANDKGKITETNEDNNCSAETILTISDSLPPVKTCLTGELWDTTALKCIPADECISPRIKNEIAQTCDNPGGGDGTSCLSTELLDTTVTPNKCIDPKDCKSPKVINETTKTCDSNGDGTTPEVNKCLLIAQNPLKFTDAEKAQLAELLRKFYIIASTLKTKDDIAMIYREIDKYKAIIGNLDDLTNQCYSETGSKDLSKKGEINIDGVDMTYAGPTLRSGNPWYTTSPWKSYIPDNSSIRDKSKSVDVCTGTFNSKMMAQPPAKNGGTCAQFRTKMDCEYYTYSPDWIFDSGGLMMTGCSWSNGTDITEYEKILNIW